MGNYESKKYKSFDIDEIMENNVFMVVNMKKESDEPTSYQDIFFRKDKDEWVTAIDNELNNMKKMNVYTPIKKLPKGVNVISTRWVFKNIHDVNGRVYKKKQDQQHVVLLNNMEQIINNIRTYFKPRYNQNYYFNSCKE